MLFTSGYFFLLVFLTGLLYYAANRKGWQIGILLVASFVFYAWNFPLLLLLLLASISINVVTARRVLSVPAERRRRVAAAGVVINLLTLAFFKYSPLIGQSFFPEQSGLGAWLISVPLPIGISFFTFQGISLVVDLYRGDVGKVEAQGGGARVQREDREQGRGDLSATGLALYIAFFPQLVAGPIVKAKDFLPQLRAKQLREVHWPSVFQPLVTGYFLKTVVADNLKDFTAYMVFPGYESIPGLDLLVLLLGYSMQIFADFAGYSLIAIGVAAFFGYRLTDNFRFPYIAQSFSEFWRRWHISLSTFLREYLYIPLGGNRGGSFFTYRNLMITMALGGLWHGAAWSYAIWGVYHGLLLALERLARDHGFVWTRRPWLRRVWVFSLVTLGWLLFRLPEFGQVLGFIEGVVTNEWYGGLERIPLVLVYCLPVVLYHLAYLYLAKDHPFFVRWGRPVGLGLMLFLILTNAGTAGDFIYFQF